VQYGIVEFWPGAFVATVMSKTSMKRQGKDLYGKTAVGGAQHHKKISERTVESVRQGHC
jgi:hypothetical protein